MTNILLVVFIKYLVYVLYIVFSRNQGTMYMYISGPGELPHANHLAENVFCI